MIEPLSSLIPRFTPRWLTASVWMLIVLATLLLASPAGSKAKERTFGQALVEKTVAKHPELSGLGLATNTREGRMCVTIADTDATEIGEKCDQDDLAVIRTDKATVEQDRDGYDVTLPLHVSGKTIGIISMDFRLGQPQASVLHTAAAIAEEIEHQIPSETRLFERAD